jgi:ankyrin repeat protein
MTSATATSSFITSCRYGNLQNAQRLYKLGYVDILADNYAAFMLSCGSGYLDVAQWLHSIVGINNDIHRSACMVAAKNGDTKMLEWLISLRFDIRDYIHDIFTICCENGHLSTAVSIHAIGMISYYSYAFSTSCVRGHIEVAKWLQLTGKIEINRDYNFLFQMICQHGYIDMAKWFLSLGGADEANLLKVGLNIHAENDIALETACRNKHIDMILFLLSLDDKFNYIHNQKDCIAKLLFDIPIRNRNGVALSGKLIPIYENQKQSILSCLTHYICSDVADMIYHYV